MKENRVAARTRLHYERQWEPLHGVDGKPLYSTPAIMPIVIGVLPALMGVPRSARSRTGSPAGVDALGVAVGDVQSVGRPLTPVMVMSIKSTLKPVPGPVKLFGSRR